MNVYDLLALGVFVGLVMLTVYRIRLGRKEDNQ
jgi:hypothetical protein